MNRRQFLGAVSAFAAGGRCCAQAQVAAAAKSSPPNIVLINCDDMGYGDIGCYGSSIRTPSIDSLASDGIRFDNFYSANAVCSPSRAGLLTGRYPTRVGIPNVLDPTATFGLPDSESTLAQLLKRAGYATMCVGKWHLGSLPQFLPTKKGFDEYFGIPYSHDMYPRVLLHNTDIVEQNATIETLTSRYTDYAVRFINGNQGNPFFLYLAHSFPHIPLVASAAFRGKSQRGIYGDVVQEIDWSTAQVLNALAQNNLDQSTLVMFMSDNGPWYQGSPGAWRGRKGQTFEGGFHVPFLARMPGRIPSGQTSSSMTTALDIVPTVANLCSAPMPANPVDGVDIMPLMTGQATDVTRDAFLYFDDWNLQCIRQGQWKLHVARYNSIVYSPDPPGGRLNLPLRNPELYDLSTDPNESYDVAPDNPDIVESMQERISDLLLGFPAPVTNAWNATMARPVEYTPAGALPLEKTN